MRDTVPRRRSALVLYGTETGNALEVAEELGTVVERLRFDTQVTELNRVTPERLNSVALTIFVISTTGQGDVPANAKTFWRSLLLKKLSSTFLSGANFVSFGLGDSSYPKFNWASRKLYKRLLQLGAKEVYPFGEADQQHTEGFAAMLRSSNSPNDYRLEGTYIPWLSGLRGQLLEKYPLPPGQEPIPADAQLLPKWVLKLDDQILHAEPIAPTTQVFKAAPDEYPRLSLLDHDVRPIPDSFTATLVENRRVTPPKHWQDVRHISLEVPEHITYSPGDVIAVAPKNFADDVQALIDIMGWQDQADKYVSLLPGLGLPSPDEIPPPPVPDLELYPNLTLRAYLTDYVNIRAIPQRTFFTTISYYTTDEKHRERLFDFGDPEYVDEFWDYTSRPRRSIIEVLDEFTSVKIPWQHIPSVFPAIRARQYSIASGGELKGAVGGGSRFELLVAVVKYKTIIRRLREGVCTRYLSVLRPGSKLRIQLQHGGLSPSIRQLAGPMVLVGPGTGVAPLRSILWEKAALAQKYQRESQKDAPPIGPTILLYGGRNRAADFFFEDEWKQVGGLVPLQVCTAFSRDQKQKIYVQDVIRQNYSLFFRLLHDLGGSVFICGSTGKMPEAVREALVEALRYGDPGEEYTEEEAEDYLEEMERIGRYRQETW